MTLRVDEPMSKKRIAAPCDQSASVRSTTEPNAIEDQRGKNTRRDKRRYKRKN